MTTHSKRQICKDLCQIFSPTCAPCEQASLLEISARTAHDRHLYYLPPLQRGFTRPTVRASRSMSGTWMAAERGKVNFSFNDGTCCFRSNIRVFESKHNPRVCQCLLGCRASWTKKLHDVIN